MCYCSGRRILFPDNRPCSRTTSSVPWQRAIVPGDISCSPTTAHVPGRRLVFPSDVSWLSGRRLLFPDNSPCSLMKFNVPGRRLVFLDDELCSRTASSVPARRLLFRTASSVPGQRDMFLKDVLCSRTTYDTGKSVMFPRQHVMFPPPDNVCCSRRRFMFLNDVLCSRTTFYGFRKTCYALFQSFSDVYRESSFNTWNRLPFPEILFPIPKVLFHSLKSSSRFVSPLPVSGMILFQSLKFSSIPIETSSIL